MDNQAVILLQQQTQQMKRIADALETWVGIAKENSKRWARYKLKFEASEEKAESADVFGEINNDIEARFSKYVDDIKIEVTRINGDADSMNELCHSVYGCLVQQLSFNQAERFIDHLKQIQSKQ